MWGLILERALLVLGVAFAFLQWAESSKWLPGWLRAISGFPFGLAIWLCVFAILFLGLRKVEGMRKRLDDMTAARPREAPRTPRGATPTWFRSHGFYWELTHNFWVYANSFDADRALTPGGGGILGPLCPSAECKVDVSDTLLANLRACPRCGSALTPGVEIRAENRPGIVSSNNSDSLFPLRKAAYRTLPGNPEPAMKIHQQIGRIPHKRTRV